MNIQDYLSSGTLELYVLDQLTPAERLEVERLRAQYPEIQRELASIESTFEKVAMQEAVEPPARLESALFQQLHELNPVRTLTAVHSARPMMYGLVASVAIALATSAIAMLYHNQLEKTTTSAAAAARQAQALTQASVKLEKENFVLKDPAFMKIMMGSVSPGGKDGACIFWNPHTRQIYIDDCNLHEIDPSAQYQLWSEENGQMVSLGVFENDRTLQLQKPAAQPKSFVVTLEKKGGAVAFNEKNMIVKGKV